MDIAEIRKKAGRSKTEPAGQDASASPTPGNDVALPVVPADPQPGAQSSYDAGDVCSDAWGSDKLDRLFSAELSLAPVDADSSDVADGGAVFGDEDLVRQYLAFNLGREEYALDIRSINEIIKVRDFTEVPRTPDFVLGIISLRGVIVPVFDLMSRLQLGQSALTASSRIVVCQTGELTVGLLVDGINQVIKLADERIEPPPAVLSGVERDLMTGVGRYQGRMIALLHTEHVLNVDLN